jgi:carbamoyl-phosphate synthase large subunit
VDDYKLRLAALKHNIPYTTTTSAALAAVEGIEAKLNGHLFVRHVQENARAVAGYGAGVRPG